MGIIGVCVCGCVCVCVTEQRCVCVCMLIDRTEEFMSPIDTMAQWCKTNVHFLINNVKLD